MLLHQRFVPGLAIMSYIVADERSGEAAVIDPTRDVGDFLRFAADNGLRIRHAIETHVHADFISGSRELKARLGDELTVWCSSMGGEAWTPTYADQTLNDGQRIDVGALRLIAHHTPGHTPEHISIGLIDTARSADTPWVLFTGDFLFVGDVGRPDLLGEEAKRELAHQLYRSVFDVLPGWDDFTEVYPAHGAGSLCGKAINGRRSSTMGYERRFNTALKHHEEAAWVQRLLDGMPIAPPYFKRMKRVNQQGPAVLGPEPMGRRRFTARQVHEQACEHCLILDVRTKESFAAAHIPGAINIPLGPSLPTWAGWVLPYDHPTLIVLDDHADLDPVVTHLTRVGFDDVKGFLEGGIDAWEAGGFELATMRTISVHDLRDQMRGADRPTVLDVRTEREWSGGHIGGAIHIHGGLLQERFERVPRDRPVAVVCGSGYRAAIAASFLNREGYEQVANVLGGMTAWAAAGLPVEAA